MEAFLARVAASCSEGGIDYHLVSTATPIEQTLLNLISARARLGRKRA